MLKVRTENLYAKPWRLSACEDHSAASGVLAPLAWSVTRNPEESSSMQLFFLFLVSQATVWGEHEHLITFDCIVRHVKKKHNIPNCHSLFYTSYMKRNNLMESSTKEFNCRGSWIRGGPCLQCKFCGGISAWSLCNAVFMFVCNFFIELLGCKILLEANHF